MLPQRARPQPGNGLDDHGGLSGGQRLGHLLQNLFAAGEVGVLRVGYFMNGEGGFFWFGGVVVVLFVMRLGTVTNGHDFAIFYVYGLDGIGHNESFHGRLVVGAVFGRGRWRGCWVVIRGIVAICLAPTARVTRVL